MANLNKKTKAELIEIIKSQDKTLMQLNNDEHSLRIEKDKFEKMYHETDEQNQRLNEQALELDTKVKAAAEEVVNLAAKLKSVRKANRGMFVGLVLMLIVWLLTLIQFAI